MQHPNKAAFAALLRALAEVAEAVGESGQWLSACRGQHLEFALQLAL
jgi:hypothetical protein